MRILKQFVPVPSEHTITMNKWTIVDFCKFLLYMHKH